MVSRRIGSALLLGALSLVPGCATTVDWKFTTSIPDATFHVTDKRSGVTVTPRQDEWVRLGQDVTIRVTAPGIAPIEFDRHMDKGPVGIEVGKPRAPDPPAGAPAPLPSPAPSPSPPVAPADPAWSQVYSAADLDAPAADFTGKWIGPTGDDIETEQSGDDVTLTWYRDHTPRNQWKGKVTGRVVRGTKCLERTPIALKLAQDRTGLTVASSTGGNVSATPFVRFQPSEARGRRFWQVLHEWTPLYGDQDLAGPAVDFTGDWLERPSGWPRATIRQSGDDATVVWSYGQEWRGKVSGRVFQGTVTGSTAMQGTTVRFKLERDGRSIAGALAHQNGLFPFEMDLPSTVPPKPENVAAAASARAAPSPPPAAAPVAPRPPQAGGTFVVVVGINATKDSRIPALRYAEDDARDVYSFFATEDRSPTAGDRVTLLTGEKATRLAILRAIREQLVAKARRPEDTAILYFAGHGFADAKETYLAGADAELALLRETGISGANLRDLWAEIPAGHKVLLVDACQSGGLEGVRGIGGVALAPAPVAAPAGAAGPSTSVTIAASGPNELSVEDENLHHGVFTKALVNGLRGGADADKDGRVSAEELGRYLVLRVPELAARANGKQTPVVEATPGSEALFLTR